MITEENLIAAIARGLMGCDLTPKITTRGRYQDASRVIEIDFGDADVGPIIGSRGSMKLAIQTLLACPHGGDACQLKIKSTAINRIQRSPKGIPEADKIEAVLKAMKAHLPATSMDFRVELADTAAIAVVTTTVRYVDEIRGALNKIVRGIGKAGGFIAMVSVEKATTANA